MKRVGIGVIGCGNISSAYLTAAKKFPILDIVALSDANPAAAEARAAEFGLPARSVDAVLVGSVDRDRSQSHGPEGACRGRPEGDRGRQARVLGKAARRRARRSARADRGGGGQSLARRLRARHVPRRRAADRAPVRRRGAHRPADRRRGILHVSGPRALAPQSRLLLSRRRRPHARHGPLLRHRARQSVSVPWRASAAWRRARGRSASSPASRSRERAFRSRSRPMSRGRCCSPAARRSR